MTSFKVERGCEEGPAGGSGWAAGGSGPGPSVPTCSPQTGCSDQKVIK